MRVASAPMMGKVPETIDDTVDSRKEETHKLQLACWDQERCQQIETGFLHEGLLIDFDYATKLDQSQPMIAGDHSISNHHSPALSPFIIFGQETSPFMSANILISYKKNETAHSASDDLELIVYVLIWMCILYAGPGTLHQDKHVTQTVLKPWVSVTNPTDAGYTYYWRVLAWLKRYQIGMAIWMCMGMDYRSRMQNVNYPLVQ
ncbi:hypothetical protein EDC04DRAFT_2600228 [Pisolithus marmoratus]|nr:hypothetical protein EDC04DRAFT_2600228 [Pisolithus marmoratus]